jgi:hypothetical protein
MLAYVSAYGALPRPPFERTPPASMVYWGEARGWGSNDALDRHKCKKCPPLNPAVRGG